MQSAQVHVAVVGQSHQVADQGGNGLVQAQAFKEAQLADGDRPAALSGDAVSVDVRCGEEAFTIAMAPGDYTAMRSWSESAPPGLHADALV